MLNHLYAEAILNAIFKTGANNGGNGSVSIASTSSRYLGLFKKMPDEYGDDYVEPSKPSGVSYDEEYRRINITNNGSYGTRMMGNANHVVVSFNSPANTVTVSRFKSSISGSTISHAAENAQNELKYSIPVKLVGGSEVTVEVTVLKGASTGTSDPITAGTIDTDVMKSYSFDEVYNQDNITFPKCIKYDWAPSNAKIIGFGIFDDTGVPDPTYPSSGSDHKGNLLYWDTLDTPMAVTQGTIPIFDIENLLKVKITH